MQQKLFIAEYNHLPFFCISFHSIFNFNFTDFVGHLLLLLLLVFTQIYSRNDWFCWHKCGNFHWKCNQVPRCAYTASDEFVYLTVLFFSSLLLAFRILTAFLREIYAGFSFFFDILASLINFFLLFKRGNNLFILNIKKKSFFFAFASHTLVTFFYSLLLKLITHAYVN